MEALSVPTDPVEERKKPPLQLPSGENLGRYEPRCKICNLTQDLRDLIIELKFENNFTLVQIANRINPMLESKGIQGNLSPRNLSVHIQNHLEERLALKYKMQTQGLDADLLLLQDQATRLSPHILKGELEALLEESWRRVTLLSASEGELISEEALNKYIMLTKELRATIKDLLTVEDPRKLVNEVAEKFIRNLATRTVSIFMDVMREYKIRLRGHVDADLIEDLSREFSVGFAEKIGNEVERIFEGVSQLLGQGYMRTNGGKSSAGRKDYVKRENE